MQLHQGVGSRSEDTDEVGMTVRGRARTHHRVHVDGTGPGVLHVGEDGGATAPSLLLLPLVAGRYHTLWEHHTASEHRDRPVVVVEAQMPREAHRWLEQSRRPQAT